VVLRDPPPKPTARGSVRVVGAVVAGLMVGGLALMLGPTLWPNAPLDLDDQAPPSDGLAPLPEGVTDLTPDQMAVPLSAPIEIAPTRYSTTETDPPWADNPTEFVNFFWGVDYLASLDEQKSQAMGEQQAQATVRQKSQAEPKQSARSTTKQSTAEPLAPASAHVRLTGSLPRVWLFDTSGRGGQINEWGIPLAPGTYAVYADLGGGQRVKLGGDVTLSPGERVKVDCKKAMATCSEHPDTTRR